MKTSKGFAFIPLMVIIAAAILVSGGIVAYQKFDQQKEEGNTSQYFEVKELGIKFRISADIADLTYVISPDNKVAHFSTRSLLAMGGNDCAADYGPIGSISTDEENLIARGELPTVESDGFRKIQGRWVYYVSPQATCTNDEQAVGISLKQIAALKSVLKTAIAIASDTSSAQVKDWKTYANSTVGISFKYPSEWHTKQINTNPFFLEIASESGTEKILVSTIDPSSNGQLYVAGKTGKGGYLVSDWQTNAEAGQYQKDIVFTKNGVPQSVIFMATHAASQKLLNEVIGTLIFSDSFVHKRSITNNTNQSGILSSTVSADEWKTYTNTELQLTFKYPSSYGQVLGNNYPVQVNKRLEGDIENAVTISKFTSRAALDLALQDDNELLLRDITEVRTPIALNGYEVTLIDKTTDIGQRRSMIMKGNSNEWFLVTSDIEDRSIVNTLFKTIFLSPYPLFDFPYTVGALYDQTKSELAAKGWFPVTPAAYIREPGIMANPQTPIDLKYPEIATCGAGGMKICTVTFKKDISSVHLTLREGTGNQYGKWVVVGTE